VRLPRRQGVPEGRAGPRPGLTAPHHRNGEPLRARRSRFPRPARLTVERSTGTRPFTPGSPGWEGISESSSEPCPPACPPARLSARLFGGPPACLAARLPVWRPACLFGGPPAWRPALPTCLPTCRAACLSGGLCRSGDLAALMELGHGCGLDPRPGIGAAGPGVAAPKSHAAVLRDPDVAMATVRVHGPALWDLTVAAGSLTSTHKPERVPHGLRVVAKLPVVTVQRAGSVGRGGSTAGSVGCDGSTGRECRSWRFDGSGVSVVNVRWVGIAGCDGSVGRERRVNRHVGRDGSMGWERRRRTRHYDLRRRAGAPDCEEFQKAFEVGVRGPPAVPQDRSSLPIGA
jgi:hypothetical protein